MSRYTSWLARPRGYRYGSWMTLYGTAGHVVGFSTACWVRSSSTADSRGLWAKCDSHCRQLEQAEVPGWLGATRVLACMGVVLSALWLLIGCPCQCLRHQRQNHKRLVRLEEVAAIVAGCFGLVAATVYGVKSCSDVTLVTYSFGWSFWLLVGGSFSGALGGVIVGVTRSHSSATPKPSDRTVRPGGPLSVLHATPPTTVELSGDSDMMDVRRGSGVAAGPGGGRRGTLSIPSVFSVFLQSTQGAEPGAGRGWTTPQCWTEDRPPPPYSVSAQMAAGAGGGGSGAMTQVYEFSLSPPPPYEWCISQHPPPPYEYQPTCTTTQHS